MPIPNATLLCRYHYDPLDRLIDCTPLAQSATQRFYLKNRLATEIQGTVQHSILQHDDQLLAQQQRQGGAVVETALLATDQQRSVLSLLDAKRPHAFAYTPYGHCLTGGGLLSLLGFNGERPEPVTGWYLLGNGYRPFNPVLMCFTSPDSWSPFGAGGVNAYAYSLNDPINMTDTTGHAPFLRSLLEFFTGKNVFSRSRIKDITIMADDAYLHFDKAGKLRRLNITAHGNPDVEANAYNIVIGNKTYTAEQLHTAIENKGIKYDTSRLIVCFSASGDNSFVQQFADFSQKPSTGFTGLVSSSQLSEDVVKMHQHFKKTHPKNPELKLKEYYSNKTHRIYKLKSPSKMVTLNPRNIALSDGVEQIRS